MTYTCVPYVYNWSQDVEKCTLDLVLSSSTRTNTVQATAVASKPRRKSLQDPLFIGYSAFELNKGFLVEKGLEIYDSDDFKIGICQEKLKEGIPLLKPFVEVDGRGGIIGQNPTHGRGSPQDVGRRPRCKGQTLREVCW